jgi:hypothetical protein
LYLTWVFWGLSLVITPALALGFGQFIEPDESDDFGMGPFLTGVLLGVLLSLVFGVAAVAFNRAWRKTHPLQRATLRLAEKAVLVAPPALLAAMAAQFTAGNFIVSAVLYLFATAIVVVILR